jgi:NAD(P)-dependent dehydrogenase (short-subunit alcohol dehydrogenase family)
VTGRVAIVTGGAGALGLSVTRRFLGAGAVVAIPYVVPAEADALRTAIAADQAARLVAEHVDVMDEAALGGFVERVRARHRRIDVLVNLVGGFAGGDLAATSLVEWRRLMDLNLTSVVVACRAVLPEMTRARYGRIVNVASRAVLAPSGGFIAYTVGKAAVMTLTQALAQEVRAQGVTVNAVAPSTMDTPGNRQAMPDADRSTWVSTDAVAAAIAFLASEEAGGVSGAVVPV